jgi:hypothetical protein
MWVRLLLGEALLGEADAKQCVGGKERAVAVADPVLIAVVISSAHAASRGLDALVQSQ